MADSPTAGPRVEFIAASTWHGSLDRADAILAAHPELASSDIHIAAILGDVERRASASRARPGMRERARASRTARTRSRICACRSICGSIRRGRMRSWRPRPRCSTPAPIPTAGFWTTGEHPEHETPLYGAAGVAHHAPLTRLLLERGADPNDDEAVYHSPETDDNAAMAALVETGRLTRENLVLMLIRKHDWHDLDGARYLLEHGADANGEGRTRGWRPLHHALARSNRLAIIELLLDHGADPALTSERRWPDRRRQGCARRSARRARLFAGEGRRSRCRASIASSPRARWTTRRASRPSRSRSPR